MKGKRIFLIISIILTFVISCFGVACGRNKNPSPEVINLSLEVSDEKINIFFGLDYQLIVECQNNGIEVDNVTFEWTTANSSVATVQGGKEKEVAIYPMRSAYAFNRRGEKSGVTVDAQLEKIKAPIKENQRVGELIIYENGIEIDRIPLLALKEVHQANILDRFKDIAQSWNG